jgi:putative lipoic acid-binding regulatory protein
MQFPKKMTTKSIGLAREILDDIAVNAVKPVAVARITGTVDGKHEDKSQFGPYISFTGKFGAINMIDGEEFRSQRLILPAVAEAAVNSMFDAAEGGSATIALDITVMKNSSDKGGTKYVFGVKPLMEPSKKDSISLLMDKFGPLPMIAAPKAAKK